MVGQEVSWSAHPCIVHLCLCHACLSPTRTLILLALPPTPHLPPLLLHDWHFSSPEQDPQSSAPWICQCSSTRSTCALCSSPQCAQRSSADSGWPSGSSSCTVWWLRSCTMGC